MLLNFLAEVKMMFSLKKQEITGEGNMKTPGQ
jgi:hypothetical protein